MIRRAAALVAVGALLSCASASLRPLERLAEGAPPGALDWEIPAGDSSLPLLDRLAEGRRDAVGRALLQRDLWMTFDIGYRREDRSATRERIAKLLLDLALPAEEIARLPDTYAESAKLFPPAFDPAKPDQPFLPPDLFDPGGPWVLLAGKNHPAATSHNSFFQWRSAFLIFVRLREGREATRKYVDALAVTKSPPIPVGIEFANVRRMMLISSAGEPVASPITESVQIRHYWGRNGDEQAMLKFELHRPELRLRPLAKSESKPSYAVSFEHDRSQESLSVPVMRTCRNCHEVGGPAGVQCFIPLMSMGLPLYPGGVSEQFERIVRLKKHDGSWQALQQLWGK